MIYKLIFWILAFIPFNIFWHIREIINKRVPDYVLTWFYRGIGFVLFTVWLTPGLRQVVELDYFLPIFAYCASSYVLIFNPTMNLLKNKFADARKVGFWYLGKHSGFFWDKFLLKYPLVYKVLYFGSIPAFIWSLIKMKMYL